MVVQGVRPLTFFFFNDTATTEIYTLSLHDALPIYGRERRIPHRPGSAREGLRPGSLLPADVHDQDGRRDRSDRKSTRLNSSHDQISYAVFCLKKKKKTRLKSGSQYARYV